MNTADYFQNPRLDILPFLPQEKKLGRVLDIGCGAGAFSANLKANGRLEYVIGAEFDASAAAIARTRLDAVYTIDLEKLTELPAEWGRFDFIFCLDVLEHLRDPWAVLRLLAASLQQDGEILISVPNVRNFRVVLPLLLKGEWRYQDTGILDRTHLRFFTKKSAVEMAERAGLKVVSIGHTGMRRGSLSYWCNLLSFGLFRGFFELQYVLRIRG